MPSDNILTVLIPGFKRPLDILFPNGKLPVCKRCKRIFKTRELCRERDGHTDIPWNTTYLCFIFDDSCLAQDAAGITRIIDEDVMQCRFTATLMDEAPELYHLKHEEITRPHTPICSLCKKKNYTRYHCREKQSHLHLPWVTFYIKLSTTPYDRPANSLPWPDNALLNNNSPWGNEYDMRNNIQASKDNIYTVGKSRALLYIVSEDSYHLRWLGSGPITEEEEGVEAPPPASSSAYPSAHNFPIHVDTTSNYSWPAGAASASVAGTTPHMQYPTHNFASDNLSSMNFGGYPQGYGGMMPGNPYGGGYQSPLMVPSTYQELEAQHARNMAMRAQQSFTSNNPYYYPESDLRNHESLSGALGSLNGGGIHPNSYQGQGFASLSAEMMQMQGQQYYQPSLYESTYSNIQPDGNFASPAQNYQSSNGQELDRFGSRLNSSDATSPGDFDRANSN